MPRRDVNDQVRDASFRDRLEMGTDSINVHAVHELSVRLQYMPRFNHEFLQVAARFLHLHQFQLEPWPVPGAVGSDRVLLR